MTIKNETIVDRVVARLKSQPLGDLITEEDLHDIVKQAIPRVFFEPQRVPNPRAGTWHEKDFNEKDPLIVEIMKELLRESATKAAKQWCDDHAEELAAKLKEVVDAGVLEYTRSIQEQMMTESLRTALGKWSQRLNEERSGRGLSTISEVF